MVFEMMRVLSVTHSNINARQWMLYKAIGELNLAEVLVIAPSTWHDENCIETEKHNFSLKCLEPVGNSFYTFRLRGLRQYILDFNPSIIYLAEEPHTILARECKKIADAEQIPYVAYTCENTLRTFGEPFDSIEKEVIQGAKGLIALSEDAKKRLIAKGASEGKISICSFTGVNCDIFKPMKDVDKEFDLMYAGRLSEEKGVRFIEQVARDLQLKMAWIGGRGAFVPSYGTYLGWLPDYLQLPEYYNKTKLFVTYPYNYHGYSEQANMTIGESMACGTPVVTSNNGSIPEVYGGAPISMAEEGSEVSLKEAVSFALSNLKNREEGIKWIRQHLSNETIGKKLIKILEGAI
jgi:glycosyltransferase involved in cell wall biosynthesis